MWVDKLLSGIRSMYDESSAYVRAKGGESGQFRVESGVIQGSEFPGRWERVEITWPLVCR